MPGCALNSSIEPTPLAGSRRIGKKEHPLTSTHDLERFLASVERRAFVMARIATGNPDDALDIVQDTMMGLAQRYANRPAQEWGPLFQTILQSRIRDWYRRSRVRNRLRVWFTPDEDGAADPIAELPDSRDAGPERQTGDGRTRDALEQALHRLPLRQQQAFVLRAWEGLDTRDTAQAMKCSEGSVKTHYSRACEALRKILKDYAP